MALRYGLTDFSSTDITSSGGANDNTANYGSTPHHTDHRLRVLDTAEDTNPHDHWDIYPDSNTNDRADDTQSGLPEHNAHHSHPSLQGLFILTVVMGYPSKFFLQEKNHETNGS